MEWYMFLFRLYTLKLSDFQWNENASKRLQLPYAINMTENTIQAIMVCVCLCVYIWSTVRSINKFLVTSIYSKSYKWFDVSYSWWNSGFIRFIWWKDAYKTKKTARNTFLFVSQLCACYSYSYCCLSVLFSSQKCVPIWLVEYFSVIGTNWLWGNDW